MKLVRKQLELCRGWVLPVERAWHETGEEASMQDEF
jgi:hypothetical protein